MPQNGDLLMEIGRIPTPTFAHFCQRLYQLRDSFIPSGGHLDRIGNLERGADRLPGIIAIGENHSERWVEVRYRKQAAGTPPEQWEQKRCWLLVQSLPAGEISLTFMWFLLQCGMLLVGAVASWSRPFDRAARLFFAMCIVVTGAFVGGYHWWVIASTVWLTVPFIICAVLVPAATLHFFLVYPEPKNFLARRPILTKSILYAAPIVALLALTAIVVQVRLLHVGGATPEQIHAAFNRLSQVVYAYLAIAAMYFAGTIGALLHSSLTTRNILVQQQVRWILWAGLLATLPVSYSLYLAFANPEAFALGSASLPMFAASLLFMLAYSIGIVRYKLMLVDQILSRGMLHYAFSVAIAAMYSVAIASGTLAGLSQQGQSPTQVWSIFATVVIAVMLLGWFRDNLQQVIDRRFFREKYALDRALSGISSEGDRLEPQTLAERLLRSCRDVLGVDRAAIYLRDGAEFRLAAVEGLRNAPLKLATSETLLTLLQSDPSLRRGEGAGGPDAELQSLLHRLDLHLLHALEVGGEVTGLVLLGQRRNGGAFSADDLAFLTAVGQIASVAINSVRVQQSLARLNDDLRLKVDKISDQQRMIAMLQAEITSRQPSQPVGGPASVETPAGQSPDALRRDLIKGNSPAIRVVLETIRKVSGSEASVLIRGESGTGKELLARAIHENSPRAGGPLVSVHCAALSPGLLESELFGHVKGSFTGAHRDRVGRFELAHKGTLFLDEIGDISLETQIKLLRVLQERSFEPVGGSRTVDVDVRLIAATHQHLERLIAEGRFREDLFYRLNVISVVLPPLRDRAADIVELTLFFLKRAADRVGKPVTHVGDDALHALLKYPWPGNIRELENVIERAVVLTDGPGLSLADLPPEVIAPTLGRTWNVPETRPLPPDSRGDGSLEPATERQQLVLALQRAHGNKAEAARLLGLPRSTFFSKLKKHALS